MTIDWTNSIFYFVPLWCNVNYYEYKIRLEAWVEDTDHGIKAL